MGEQKPLIGFDLDSVLNTLDKDWLDAYNADYNDNMTSEDLQTWNTNEWVKPECGLKIFDYLLQPGFFRNLGVTPGAQEVIKWLSQYAELYVVTAYHWNTCRDKAEFIIEHFPEINPRNIIFLNNKGLINLDYLVDDGPHNIEVFKGQGIVVDKRYNRYLPDIYPRFQTFDEIKRYFMEAEGFPE